MQQSDLASKALTEALTRRYLGELANDPTRCIDTVNLKCRLRDVQPGSRSSVPSELTFGATA